MQTKGQYIVGADFNPSKDSLVDELKQKSAEFIDLVDSIEMQACSTEMEDVQQRAKFELKQQAMRYAEIACMLAVKAATKPEPK